MTERDEIRREAMRQVYSEAAVEVADEIISTPGHLTAWLAMRYRLLARYRDTLAGAYQ